MKKVVIAVGVIALLGACSGSDADIVGPKYSKGDKLFCEKFKAWQLSDASGWVELSAIVDIPGTTGEIAFVQSTQAKIVENIIIVEEAEVVRSREATEHACLDAGLASNAAEVKSL